LGRPLGFFSLSGKASIAFIFCPEWEEVVGDLEWLYQHGWRLVRNYQRWRKPFTAATT